MRVGAVSYLNTKPLLYGILHSPLSSEIDLCIDYPSRIADMLLQDEIDMGLVPVAVIPQMESYFIYTDYCIGSEGAVGSVCLFSETSMLNIRRILLDYESLTSIELAKVLIRNYWKIDPQLVDTKEDFGHLIKGDTAGIIIGDRALRQRMISTYVYDLGEAWSKFTGLPFVFAAWVANKKLEDDFIDNFNRAVGVGIKNIELVLRDLPYEGYDLRKYFTENISYSLDIAKRNGLRKFLGMLQTCKID